MFQEPGPVADVLNQSLKETGAARIAAFVLNLFSPTKGNGSTPARFREGYSGLNEFLDLLVEVKAHLVVEVVLDGVAAKQRAQAHQKVTEHFPLRKRLIMRNLLSSHRTWANASFAVHSVPHRMLRFHKRTQTAAARHSPRRAIAGSTRVARRAGK